MGEWKQFKCTPEYGIQVNEEWSIGFDVPSLIALLAMPRNFRKQGAFASKLIRVTKKDRVKTVPPSSMSYDSDDFSLLKIMNASYGVNLEWRQPKPVDKGSWFAGFFKNVVGFALSSIPGIGPVLSAAWSVGWTAVKNPDMTYTELKNQFPFLDLVDHECNDLMKSAKDARK